VAGVVPATRAAGRVQPASAAAARFALLLLLRLSRPPQQLLLLPHAPACARLCGNNHSRPAQPSAHPPRGGGIVPPGPSGPWHAGALRFPGTPAAPVIRCVAKP